MHCMYLQLLGELMRFQFLLCPCSIPNSSQMCLYLKMQWLYLAAWQDNAIRFLPVFKIIIVVRRALADDCLLA